MSIYIGTSGYNYNHWVKIFYPENLKSKDFFNFYQQYFETVEINYTFYHFPSERTIQKWYKEAKDKFFFSLKVPKFITHLKKLDSCDEELKDFLSQISFLEEKLGVILFQLPPSFHFNNENIDRIKNIINILPRNFRYSFEFRHLSWFNLDNNLNIFRDNNISIASVSAPRLPFKIYDISDLLYIRFHGLSNWYNYNYSEEELLSVVNLINNSYPYIKEIWIYFNNDFNGYAVLNALLMKKLFALS